MPAGLALFWAGAAGLAALAWAPGWTRLVTLALAMAGAEWLRGHVLYRLSMERPGICADLAPADDAVGGDPGHLRAHAGGRPDIFRAGGGLGRCTRTQRPRTGSGIASRLSLASLHLLLAGAYRLGGEDLPGRDDVRIRVVQPSVPQREKWRPENQGRIFRDHLELSRTIQRRRDRWRIRRYPYRLARSRDAVPAAEHTRSAGGDRPIAAAGHAPRGWRPARGARLRAVGRAGASFNSLMVFGQGGRLVGLYDKIHLVPFGEYLPFQATLEAIGLEQLTRIRGGFDVGVTPRPMLQAAGPAADRSADLLRGDFSAELVQGSERPAFMVNVTNDGWFGQTTGPHQHLHQARVRAVEEGVPIVRAANNGISAVIDAPGTHPGLARSRRARNHRCRAPPCCGAATLCPLRGLDLLGLFAAAGGLLLLGRLAKAKGARPQSGVHGQF